MADYKVNIGPNGQQYVKSNMQPLVDKYPDIIPKFTHKSFDDRANGGAMQNWARFGTDKQDVTVGYGDSPTLGNYLFGDLYLRDSNLPSIDKTFNTPWGDLNVTTDGENPGVETTFLPDERTQSIYNTLIQAYKNAQDYNNQYNQNATPLQKFQNNLVYRLLPTLR